jgi:membrane protease YdiL (CAAX protease family)
MDAPVPERFAPAAPAGPGRPRTSPLGFASAVLLVHVLGGGPAQAVSPAAGLAWSQLFAFLLPAAAAASGANLDPRRFLLLARRPTAGQVGLGILLGLASFTAAAPTVALWSAVLPPGWVSFFDLGPLFRGPPAERAVLVALTSLLAPVCEELAFRGYLLSALRIRLGTGAALAAGTLLFAAMHLDPVRLPALLVQGAAFGWLAIRSGSIWPAVAGHAANNLAAALLAAAAPAEAPEAPQGTLPALAMLAVGIAALAAVGGAWRRATPSPPPASEDLAPRDPSAPFTRFSLDRLPARYLLAAILGLAWLGALAAWRG